MAAEEHDLMTMLKEAKQEFTDTLADTIRAQRRLIDKPLPTEGVEELGKDEQLQQYRQMLTAPELAVAEIARQQQQRGILRPKTLLRHLAKMQREMEKQHG